MFDWLDARAPRLMPASELSAWPGAGHAATRVVRLSPGTTASGGSSAITLAGEGPVAVVPLELGGLLVVCRVRADSETGLSGHLDLLPLDGWMPLSERFLSRTDAFVLFDSSHPGKDLAKLRSRTVPVVLDPGSYDVEAYANWRPDTGTEVHLVRLIRAVS